LVLVELNFRSRNQEGFAGENIVSAAQNKFRYYQQAARLHKEGSMGEKWELATDLTDARSYPLNPC